jgi:septal ring factor EnvC (AmiA/AmiB activator)
VNENPYFWSSYAVKLSVSAAPAVGIEKTMNAPPPRSILNVQVSYSAITQKNTGSKTSVTASTAPETAAISTSSISNTHNNEDDNGMQQLKLKLAEIDQERSQFKTQQQKVEDDVSTLTQSMTKMGGNIPNIRQDMAKLNQQLHEITIFL